jgi:hypothetical protein
MIDSSQSAGSRKRMTWQSRRGGDVERTGVEGRELKKWRRNTDGDVEGEGEQEVKPQ